MYHQSVNKTQVLHKLQALLDAYKAGEIPQLHKHEVNPGLNLGSRENYLYYMMTCSLNYQRSSPKTWQSALDTWKDESTRYVFFPEKVVKSDTARLRADLLKHRLALQPERHIHIWQTLMKTLHDEFQSDPRVLFSTAGFDTDRVLHIVQKEMKKRFPYLSGPKLSNYFIYILLNYSDLELKNKEHLSIIPDTHIQQATAELGILPKNKISPTNVEQAWRELLAGTQWSPVDFHPILWNWSRNGFKPEVG